MNYAKLVFPGWSSLQVEECIICTFCCSGQEMTNSCMTAAEEVVSGVPTVHSDEFQSRIRLDAKFCIW
jgi:hypothetical protein